MVPQPGSPADMGRYQVLLDGKMVTYTLRQSARAKYARLEVRQDVGLVVVIPRSYEVHHLSALLRQKRRWILGKLSRLGHPKGASPAGCLKTADSIPYLGRELAVVKVQSRDGRDGTRLEGDRLVVSTKEGDRRVALVVEGWYRVQAARVLKQRVVELSARMGVAAGRVSIRAQRTRWGSCSGKGNLIFNWRLLMAPPPVIDYVVVHELAHLKELNHSKTFWRFVAEHCPEWREYKKWLKEHEAELACALPSCARGMPHLRRQDGEDCQTVELDRGRIQPGR